MMHVIESDRVAFFDCDDTLILWEHQNFDLPVVTINGRHFQIHTGHLKKIFDYKVMGFQVVVWSTSGHQWAKTVVEALGIENHVDFVMCKPHRIFDDVKDISETLKHGYVPLK